MSEEEKPRASRSEAAEARAAAGYPVKQRSAKNRTHSSHALLEIDMAPAPGSQFHLFSGLPSELRLKIFQFAAYHEGRIIELERTGTLEQFVNQRYEDTWHASIQVCRKSKKAPALLHACRNSRFEALLHYKLMNLSTEPNTPIYFNPVVDIIYFNETMCPGSMVYLSRLDLDIRHVAVPCNFTYDRCPVHGCHECDDEGLWLNGEGLTHLQALHGVSTTPDSDPINIPGFKNLEEVTFIVRSNLWIDEMGIYNQQTPGQTNDRASARFGSITREWLESLGGINGAVTLRPAISEGHCIEEIGETHKIKDMILDLESDVDLPDVGDQRWITEGLPNFTFRSFAPRAIGPSENFYDAVAIPSHHVVRLRKHHSKYIEDLETSLNCKITVCGKRDHTELYSEIGLCGTKEFVAQAKGAILNILNIKPGKQYNDDKETAQNIRNVGGLEFY